jgi:hypothetical protein
MTPSMETLTKMMREIAREEIEAAANGGECPAEPNENDLWIELGDLLGVDYSDTWSRLYVRPNGPTQNEAIEQARSMLHGMACREANGAAFKSSGGGWLWRSALGRSLETHGEAVSEPAALIAMLKAYRGH